MSLPSLKDVLRSIGLPGSPQKGAGSCGTSSRKDRGNGTGTGNHVGSGGGSNPSKEVSSRRERECLSTPESGSRADNEETSSAGGRRRRLEPDDTLPGDWDSPSTQSVVSEGSGSVSTTIGADPSGGWGSASSYDDSDAAWDPGESHRHRQAVSALAVSPSGGHFGSSYSKKKARLATRTAGFNEIRGAGDSDERERSGGSGPRGKNTAPGSVLDQIYRHPPQSHSTDEWRAVQKAARVLGVDSLEERDVEDQRLASMVKAASVLGVDNVEDFRELQQSAAGNRLKWAPPKSSASKAARIVGIGVEDVAELQIQASRQRNSERRRSAYNSGNRPRHHQQQGSISCLIRALEITSSEPQRGSGEQQAAGVREEETGSAHSGNSANSSVTRGTESCSSVSDLPMPDAEGSGECSPAMVAVTRSGSSGGASLSAKKSDLLPDDQLAGLQTPQHMMASAESSRNEGRSTRDDMEVETPPSQLSKSAALTSLKQAPAPLLAPYTPTMPGTCRSSPSPIGSVGPGPSPAGSPLGPGHLLTPRNGGMTPASAVPARSSRSDFAAGGNGGERSPLSQQRAGTAAGPKAYERSGEEDVSPRLGAVAEGKGSGGTSGNEALGNAPEGSGWNMATPAPSPITTAGVNTGAGAHRSMSALAQGQQASRLARLGSSPTTPAPSPIEPQAWGSATWTSQPTFAIAGGKDTSRSGLAGMEYKQESPVGTSAEWSPPPANLAALSQSSGWRSPEETRELGSPIPGDRRGWPLPERPSSAPIPGSHPQLMHNGRYSPVANGVSRGHLHHPMASSARGSASGEVMRSERSIGSGESSGDSSESASEAYPDRMDDGEDSMGISSAGGGAGGNGSGPVSAYKELAAMIPFINPSGIGSQGNAASAGYPVKSEDSRVGVGSGGKIKQRRRPGQSRTSSWSEDSSEQIALSPLLPKTQDFEGGGAQSEQEVEGGPLTGVSTRKQQEVATRPREKGRFVKRPPAFLPISAFRNTGDRTEADVAAERAEEAREEAVEAAERAAAAAAAAAAGQRPGAAAFSPSSSAGSPPATLASLAEAGGSKKASYGGTGGGAAGGSRDASPWSGASHRSDQYDRDRGEDFGQDGGGGASRRRVDDARDGHDEERESTAVHLIGKQSSPISSCVRGVGRSVGQYGIGGGAGVRQGAPGRGGRGDPLGSPLSRVSHTDIWNQHDSDAEGSETAGMGVDDHGAASTGSGGREASDCGSERGCEDLRGLQFLPFSPKDGVSPRSSTWDSPRRGIFSAAGSAHSTPVHSHRRGHDGRGFGPNASPRPGSQAPELPPSSPGGGIPWQGARREAGSDTGPGGRGDQGR